MSKQKYEQPVFEMEIFNADEYVAACGDTVQGYLFKCNAPPGALYLETNGTSGLQKDVKSPDTKLDGFERHPSFEVLATADAFSVGYVVTNAVTKDVFIYRDENDEYHAAGSLTSTSWITTKS